MKSFSKIIKFWKRPLVAFLFVLSSPWVSAETFHAIIIAETSDPEIRTSVKADSQLAEKFAKEIGRHFQSASVRVLAESDASISGVRSAIGGLSLESDDFVFIFYSGHGDKSTVGSPWPNLSLLGGAMEARDLLFALSQKHSLRHLVVFDACNGAGELPIERTPASVSFNSAQVSRLFKEITGSVLVTSSEPGFVSYADIDGGSSRFSRAFFEVMNSAMTSSQAVSWGQLLDRVASRTASMSDQFSQVPKYMLSPNL